MTRVVEMDVLKDVELFKGVSESALIELAKSCRAVELRAGETLFRQDDPGDTFYVLADGQVHIIREYADGEQVILATEGPYYVVGELSTLVNQPRTGSVIAVSDSTLIAIERKAFEVVCAQVPDVAMRVLYNLGHRLYRMNLRVREQALGNVEARVASALLLLCGGRNGQVEKRIYLSRVARASATDPDRVERLFQHWDEKGYLTFEHGQITIHDLTAIKQIAG